MWYVHYINSRNVRVTIHKSSCMYYRARKSYETYNGRWRVGFLNFEEAHYHAKNPGYKNIRACLNCCLDHML